MINFLPLRNRYLIQSIDNDIWRNRSENTTNFIVDYAIIVCSFRDFNRLRLYSVQKKGTETVFNARKFALNWLTEHDQLKTAWKTLCGEHIFD